MIAFKSATRRNGKMNPKRRHKRGVNKETSWQDRYLELLPSIHRQARRAIRHVRGEAREDALQEIIADTVVAYARLAELHKEDLAYATPLVQYAVAKFHVGRRVGSSMNGKDVTSPYCQRRKCLVVERLDRFDSTTGQWKEVLIDDRHTTPAELAAFRMDFSDWLESLSPRDKRLAEILATGESTGSVAKMFAVTAGRVSQLRLKLHESWCRFIGELSPTTELAAVFA